MLYREKATRAYNEWERTDHDIRVFLALGLKFAHAAYTEMWSTAEGEPGWLTEVEVPDRFNELAQGVWPHDFEWMLLAGGLTQ